MHIWKQGKLFALPHAEAMQTAPAGKGSTLPDLLRAPHERGRIGLLILLLTLNAAWIDMLSYLSGSRVRVVYDGQLPVHWTGRGSGK